MLSTARALQAKKIVPAATYKKDLAKAIAIQK